MNISMEDFTCNKNFEEVNTFLSKTFLTYQKNYNWDNARWNFNRYCIHHDEEIRNNRVWERSVKIWREHGRVIAVAHIEEPGDYFIEIDPEYKTIEEEMFDWIFWDSTYGSNAKNTIKVSCFENDRHRRGIIEKYHGERIPGYDIHRMMKIDKRKSHNMKVDNGYCIKHFSEFDKRQGLISHLYTTIWPNSMYIENEEVISLVKKSPSFQDNLSFVLLEKAKKGIGFCIAWIDGINQAVHFYPIAILSEYCNDENALEYMMCMALEEIKSLNYHTVTLSGYYDEYHENVFKKIGFIETEKEIVYKILL